MLGAVCNSKSFTQRSKRCKLSKEKELTQEHIPLCFIAPLQLCVKLLEVSYIKGKYGKCANVRTSKLQIWV